MEHRQKDLTLELSSDLSFDELELEEEMDQRTLRELEKSHISIFKNLMSRIIDAASGGALMRKTPREAWDLLNNMVINSQQFGQKEALPVKEASDVSSIQRQLTELISFVRQFVSGKAQIKAFRICASSEHPTDICPTLSQKVDVSAAGFIPRAYNHYSNTYNLGWKDQPNLKYMNQQSKFGDHSRGFPTLNHPPQPPQTVPSNSLEDLMKTMASNILPSQPDVNPRNVSSIVIQNGKDSEVSKIGVPKDKNEKDIKKEIEQDITETLNNVTFDTPTNTKTNVAPFPCRLVKPNKDDKNKKMMEMFRKVELNILLLDAIKQVPKYAKFLKDLCANKNRLHGDKCIIIGESVSAVLQRKLPHKCRDPADRTNANPERMIEDVLVQGVLRLHEKSILDIKSKPHLSQLKLVHLNDNVNLAKNFFPNTLKRGASWETTQVF
ncbi:uncharacterized protein LOC127261681 [Andrographis paniculata]|uniref:uncharacterized protein LOC127261681 n=1 Tax=Andrographis paniculata TaxID=175694 RepID=UPI0021E6ED43|nr:uncharacterized protein LOC127261681 [Andrographis paniculata]